MYVSMLRQLLLEFPSYNDIAKRFPSLIEVVRRIDLEASFHRYFFVFLLLIVSIVYLIHKVQRNYPPGPISWPIIGSLDFFRSKPHIHLSNMKAVYGDVFSIKAGHYDMVVVSSLEGILEGLENDHGMLDGRPKFSVYKSIFRGDQQKGMLSADSDVKLQIKRKFLIDSFHSLCSAPSGVERDILQETMNLMCYMLQQLGPFDPKECFKFAHLHIMNKVVFNEHLEGDDVFLNACFDALDFHHDALKLQLYNYLPWLSYFYRDQLHKIHHGSFILTKYEKMLLNAHKDTYDPAKVRDIADQMLLFIEADEDREILESDDMNDILIDILSAGFHSVPALLSWLLGYMAAFPDIQQRVQLEIDETTGRGRFPSLRDEALLPYTMAVILEVQRIVTISPFLLPHRAVKNCVFQGYDIPADTLLLFNVWSLHHDPRYWHNPMKFNPSRFLDDEGCLTIPDHFLPFGSGSRRCPGEGLVEIEVFLIFTCIMHQFIISASTEQTPLNLQSEFSWIISPKQLLIQVTEREE